MIFFNTWRAKYYTRPVITDFFEVVGGETSCEYQTYEKTVTHLHIKHIRTLTVSWIWLISPVFWVAESQNIVSFTLQKSEPNFHLAARAGHFHYV